jgi:hypothetical protein
MHIGPEIFFGIGAVILLAVIAWGVVRNRQRNRANDPITEAATREEYRHPNSYDEEKFKAQLHPKR